jgi:hypothetical protein
MLLFMIKHYGTKLWTKFGVNLYSVPNSSNYEFWRSEQFSSLMRLSDKLNLAYERTNPLRDAGTNRQAFTYLSQM